MRNYPFGSWGDEEYDRKEEEISEMYLQNFLNAGQEPCIRGTMCCGVREFNGVNYTPSGEEVLAVLVDQYIRGTRAACYILTEVAPGEGGYQYACGDDFMQAVNRYEAGTVVRTRYKVNPNSGNRVRVYSFNLNHRRVNAIANQLRAEHPEWTALGKYPEVEYYLD